MGPFQNERERKGTEGLGAAFSRMNTGNAGPLFVPKAGNG